MRKVHIRRNNPWLGQHLTPDAKLMVRDQKAFTSQVFRLTSDAPSNQAQRSDRDKLWEPTSIQT